MSGLAGVGAATTGATGGVLGAVVVLGAIAAGTVSAALHVALPSWIPLAAFLFAGHGINASGVALGKSVTAAATRAPGAP